jgi:hypothetical protein
MYLLIVLLVVIVLVIIILLLVFKRVYLGTYRIDEAFIVDKHGLCLAHRSRRVDSDVDTDEDIFSGMLTVIQQFVKDSFKAKDDKEEEEYLNMFKYGDTTVLIEQGKRIFVAVFFKGTPGKTLDKKVKRFLTDIEKRHESIIRTWTGDMRSMAILGKKLGELVGAKGKVDMEAAMVKATAQPLDTGVRSEPPRRQVEQPMEEEDMDQVAMPEEMIEPGEEVVPELEGTPPEELPEMEEMLALPEGTEVSEDELEDIDLDELDALDELWDETEGLEELEGMRDEP